MLRAQLETHLNSFHLSLDFEAWGGKTTVLLGESGAGKSTALRLLAGLLRPERGRIELDEIVYFDSERRIAVPPQERPFGYVFQDYTLFPHLSVYENVAFGLRAQHMPRSEVSRRVGEALEQVRLVGYDERRPAQLSGGQQQRVAIARALVLQPQLLLLDEPLSALDVQTRREVRQELRQILSGAHITTILVTHHYLEALLFGEHILVLDAGRIIQQGSQRDLLQYPRSSYVAELIGMNFFRGRVISCEADALCSIRVNGQNGNAIEVRATLVDRARIQSMPVTGTEAFVVVDPRSITLYAHKPDSSARNVFQGEIVQLLPLGSAAGDDGARDGRVRVGILLHAVEETAPLTAEITEASAARMELREGNTVFAAFKATEARAYL